MVEDVEEIRARLKRKPLCEPELSPQSQMDMRRAESAQRVSARFPWIAVEVLNAAL